jgi:uncharacterized membrane protein YeaQ/YmgE (transglycosylase-associated protein family)
MQDSDVGDSTLQLVIDQLEELVVTIIEEVRERPGIALALVAGVVGAVVGSWLARRKRAAAAVRGARGTARSAGDTASLLGTVMRMLQNPLVRALIVATIERQVRRRLAL